VQKLLISHAVSHHDQSEFMQTFALMKSTDIGL